MRRGVTRGSKPAFAIKAINGSEHRVGANTLRQLIKKGALTARFLTTVAGCKTALEKPQ